MFRFTFVTACMFPSNWESLYQISTRSVARLPPRDLQAWNHASFVAIVLMGNAEGAARNEHFRTIAEHDMTFFQKNDRSDLEATIKYWIGLLPRMSKQEISLRERCLGFNLDPHSVWNSLSIAFWLESIVLILGGRQINYIFWFFKDKNHMKKTYVFNPQNQKENQKKHPKKTVKTHHKTGPN